MPFRSKGRPVRLGPDAVCVWFGVRFGSKNPFSFQTDPSNARSETNLEPINGAKPVFPETAIVFSLITSKES